MFRFHRLRTLAHSGPRRPPALLKEYPVKADLHPVYRKLTAVCACGNSFETRSTSASIHVEVCAQCHPYFTGKQRLMDTAGRVDRFRRRYQSGADAAKA